jgi:hypothetical protein
VRLPEGERPDGIHVLAAGPLYTGGCLMTPPPAPFPLSPLRWYAKPLWSRLAETPRAYPAMMTRRKLAWALHPDRQGVERSLLGMSLARQPSMWDLMKTGPLPRLMVG